MLSRLKTGLIAIVTIVCAGSSTANEYWKGAYVQLGLGYDFTGGLELGVEGVGNTELPTSGPSLELRFGVLFEPFNRWYIGPVVGLEVRDVSANQTYRFGPAYSDLEFETDLGATIGLELAYQPRRNDRLLFSIEGGLAGQRGQACGTVGVFSLARTECTSGYAMGKYAATSVRYALGPKVASYARLTHTWFDFRDDFTIGNQTATPYAELDPWKINIGLQYRF